MSQISDKQYWVLALADASDNDQLRRVVQIAAIVRCAGIDLKLTVLISAKSQSNSVLRLESAFNVPGMCDMVFTEHLSEEKIRNFTVALAPCELSDDTPGFEAVKAADLPVILKESVANEATGLKNSIKVPTDLMRHFASALYQSLHQKVSVENNGEING
ncbi:MAG: hypothetical protein JXM68_08655 [Sedimentisphaerales bacterium]|nr:hypothetical protein [Sedimentisphaerales bacterium]